MRDAVPPQEHARGQRQALDARWLRYLNENGVNEDGGALLVDAHFRQGIDRFNAGEFFEAHESFEAAWGGQPYPQRLFCLSLTKIATGMAHAKNRNVVGSRRLIADGLRLLKPFLTHYASCNVARLADELREWSEEQQAPLPGISHT